MTFPLQLSPNRRYLVDAQGAPWLYHGDTGWRMPQRLRLDEVDYYLENRAIRGYNAIHIHAINKEMEGAINADGHQPFAGDDLTQPNEPYWEHLDAILEAIARRGLLAVVSAAWFGAGGRGWRDQIMPATAAVYGRFLGKRYRHFANIVWVQGGDNDPGDRSEATRVLACTLRQHAPHHLQTYHAQAEHPSTMFFDDDDWLDINFAYTYEPAHQHVLSERNRTGIVRPIILGETGYEDEANTGFRWTAPLVRRQVYWALLAGAAGHAHGSARVWHFGEGWREALHFASDRHMRHVVDLFTARAWHFLVPDQEHRLLVDGHEDGVASAVAACTPDGTLGLVYLPTHRAVVIDPQQLAAGVEAHWYDPTSGEHVPLVASPLPTTTGQCYVPPPRNSAGDEDWVLVLETGAHP